MTRKILGMAGDVATGSRVRQPVRWAGLTPGASATVVDDQRDVRAAARQRRDDQEESAAVGFVAAGEDAVGAAGLVAGRVTGAGGAAPVEIEHALGRIGSGEGDHPRAAVALIVASRLADPASRIEREGGGQPLRPSGVVIIFV